MYSVYKVKPSNSATLLNYTLLHLLICGVCSATFSVFVFGGKDISAENVTSLISLYIWISFAVNIFAGIIMKYVNDRHTLVRLSVFLVASGLLYPVSFGLNVKVILCSIGSSLFNVAAGSTVVLRSKFKALPIGIFFSSGIVGLSVGNGAPIFGYLMLLLMLFIASAPDNGVEFEHLICADSDLKFVNKKLIFVLIPTLLLSIAFRTFVVGFVDFSWNNWYKIDILLSVVTAIGIFVGGALYDKLGGIVLACLSIPMGIFLSVNYRNLMWLSLFDEFLLGMTVSVAILFIYRLLPKRPGTVVSAFMCSVYLGNLIDFEMKWEIAFYIMVLGFYFVSLILSEILIKHNLKQKMVPLTFKLSK